MQTHLRLKPIFERWPKLFFNLKRVTVCLLYSAHGTYTILQVEL